MTELFKSDDPQGDLTAREGDMEMGMCDGLLPGSRGQNTDRAAIKSELNWREEGLLDDRVQTSLCRRVDEQLNVHNGLL